MQLCYFIKSLCHCVFLSVDTLKVALWKMSKFFKYLEILFPY